jgi:L-rhamnose mutarotase
MPRLCFALDLNDDADLISAYESRHRPGRVWAEIIDDIREEGFLSMEIWRTGDRLVMIAEVAEDFPRGARGARMTAIFDRWQAEMDQYQRRLPHAGPDEMWVPMTRIFDLDAHSGSGDPDSPAIRRP